MKKISFSEAQVAEILELYSGGHSRKNISNKLKLSEHAIRLLIIQSNIPDRPYKYIGATFGKLTVLEKLGNHKNGCPIVRCKCACGNYANVIVSNLLKKKSATVSCGCYNKDKNLSKHPWFTEFNAYIYNVVEKRNLSFNLSLDDFQEICSATCFYCGSPPKTKMQVGRGLKNGIDRINNVIGYEPSNCVSCCWNCNRMKGKMTHKEFTDHIQKIYKHSFQ